MVFDLDGVILDIDELKQRFPSASSFELYNRLTQFAVPVRSTVEFIREVHERHCCYILSSRRREGEPTMQFVRRFLTQRGLARYFKGVYLVESPEEKNDVLRKLKADVYFDDTQEYLDVIKVHEQKRGFRRILMTANTNPKGVFNNGKIEGD